MPHRCCFTLLCLLLAGAPAIAQEGGRARTEAQARRVSERLAALQREADALATEQRSLLVDLRRLELDRELRTTQLAQVERDTSLIARELEATSARIADLDAQTARSRPMLESRMVELYKLGGAGYLRLFLNVSDLRELGRAYRMVAATAAIDRQRAEDHRRNLESLRAAHDVLEQRHADMARLQKQAESARAGATRAAAAHTRLIADIDRRRDLTAELANELLAAQQRLRQTLAAMTSGAPRPADAPLSIRSFRGDLDWPVRGRLLARRAGGVAGAAAQNGVQFATDDGVPVAAVHEGTVAYAGPFTGYGTLVIIDHGAETFSLYGQLGEALAARGERVERGQTIGSAGRVLTGISGMSFEMRVDGQTVDPLEWLRKR